MPHATPCHFYLKSPIPHDCPFLLPPLPSNTTCSRPLHITCPLHMPTPTPHAPHVHPDSTYFTCPPRLHMTTPTPHAYHTQVHHTLLESPSACPTLPCPTLTNPNLFHPTLPYSTQSHPTLSRPPYSTLPHPTSPPTMTHITTSSGMPYKDEMYYIIVLYYFKTIPVLFLSLIPTDDFYDSHMN